MLQEWVSKESAPGLHNPGQCYNENNFRVLGFFIIAHYDFTKDAFAPVSSKHYKETFGFELGRGLYLAYQGTDLL